MVKQGDISHVMVMVNAPGVDLDAWGFIPGFLDPTDPRSAKEQINEHYISGWSNQEGFKLNDKTGILTYPGDPPMKPMGAIMFRQERVVLYPYEYVAIIQDDSTFEVCRLD